MAHLTEPESMTEDKPATFAAPTAPAAPAPRVVKNPLAGDIWGGMAAMLVALPSAIAFGVTIFAPLGGTLAAQGALAGILGATALGLVAAAFGGCQRLISAPCAPAAAVLSALAISFTSRALRLLRWC